MSIDYFAVPTRDESRIGPIIEGDDLADPIDQAKVREALKYLANEENQALRWEVNNDYIFVSVLSNHVQVNHNAGRGSAQIAALMDILYDLQQLGLHVWDPQQGKWYPG